MLLAVADAANFSSLRLTPVEKTAMAKTWSRILLRVIPENRLLDALERAILDHRTSFAVNGYDLKLAYERIVAEEDAEIQSRAEEDRAAEAEKRAVNPVLYCAEKHLHVSGFGETEICNPLNFNETVILPCATCRPTAYAERRAAFIAAHGRVEPDVLVELQKEAPKPKIEAILPAADALELQNEHNRLVCLIVEDSDARRNLELVFDEGGNCFKLPHRADLTYSPDAMRSKIESYKRIVS